MQTKKFFVRAARWLRYAHRLFGTLFMLVVLIVVCNAFGFTLFRVDGHSMEPTLQDKQLLTVCLVCVRVSQPVVGDIVIVQYEGASSVRFVKRVVGAPGDKVPYLGSTYTLKSKEYFVAGDNRDHSTDSRVYGPIQRSQIIGVVLGSFEGGPGQIH